MEPAVTDSSPELSTALKLITGTDVPATGKILIAVFTATVTPFTGHVPDVYVVAPILKDVVLVGKLV